jgi:hypothetical protein
MKILIGILFIGITLYGGIYLLDTIGILNLPQKQYSASATQIIKSPAQAEEKTFKKPVQVDWSGEIFGVLQSGNGYAIKRLDVKAKYPQFMAFWPEDKMEWVKGGVRIKGWMEGIDCAYQNTIFAGECVPFVTIKSLEKIEIIKK